MKKIALALLFLAACNREEKPEAPSPAEDARLNEAEDMLDNMANEMGPESETPSDPNLVSD